MRLADMHIHTTFSPDGKSSMEEQCIKAIEIPSVDIARETLSKIIPKEYLWLFSY